MALVYCPYMDGMVSGTCGRCGRMRVAGDRPPAKK